MKEGNPILLLGHPLYGTNPGGPCGLAIGGRIPGGLIPGGRIIGGRGKAGGGGGGPVMCIMGWGVNHAYTLSLAELFQ